MKSSAIVRIVLFSLAILILGGILLSAVCFNMYIVDGTIAFESHSAAEEAPLLENEMQETSSQVCNLELEWVAGSITIQPDEHVHSIHVTEYTPSGSDYETVMQQSGQTLKIKFSKESVKLSGFSINANVSKDLVITVPADWNCNSIDIDAAAADVKIHDLKMNELDFDGASGKLILDNCDIVELDIDTASGDVDFSGTLNELDFDAASARFDGEFHNIPQKLNLDAMSGDMTLVLPENSGFSLELDSMSGSFDSDFDFHTMGAHYECGDSSCKIKVSALSGDVEILKGISQPKNCDH